VVLGAIGRSAFALGGLRVRPSMGRAYSALSLVPTITQGFALGWYGARFQR